MALKAEKKEMVVAEHGVRQDVVIPSYTFETLERMSASMAKSGMFGVKTPEAALAIMMLAQAEGKHPVEMLRDYDVIQGRPSKKAEAMFRDFLATGGKLKWEKLDDEAAIAVFQHPATSGEAVRIDWTQERARKAGLAGKEGSMYTKFGRAMLRSRCIAEGVRSTAPMCTSGSYTQEELRDMEIEKIETTTDKTVAITDNTNKEVKLALPAEEQEQLINSMDVKDLPTLQERFKVAWKRAKDAGDDAAKARFQSVYNMMKGSLQDAAAAEQAKASADAQPAQKDEPQI